MAHVCEAKGVSPVSNIYCTIRHAPVCHLLPGEDIAEKKVMPARLVSRPAGSMSHCCYLSISSCKLIMTICHCYSWQGSSPSGNGFVHRINEINNKGECYHSHSYICKPGMTVLIFYFFIVADQFGIKRCTISF